MRNINVPVVQGLVDLNSPFGPRNGVKHHGADFFPVPRGRKLPVLAFDSGIVTLTQRGHRTSGNWLEILQDDGLTFTYGCATNLWFNIKQLQVDRMFAHKNRIE